MNKARVIRFAMLVASAVALALAPFIFASSVSSGPHGSSISIIWSILFNPTNPLSKEINWLIFALTAIALFGLITACAQIFWNDYFLARATDRFEVLKGQKVDQLPLVVLLQGLGLDGPGKGTFVAERIRNLYRLRSRRTVDVSVLKEITGDHLNTLGGFARFIAGSLTVLGLIGTVLGLALAVGELAPLVGKVESVRDIAAFTGQMLKTLAAMQTAFSCTLAGLVCAFTLSIATFLVTRIQLNLLARLEDFSNYELVPVLMPPAADHAIAQFSEKLIEVGQIISDAFGRVDAATQKYLEGTTAVRATAEQVTLIAADSRKSHESTRDQLHTVSEDISAAAAIFKSVKATMENTETVTETVAKELGRLTAAITSIGAFPEKLQGALDAAMKVAIEQLHIRNAAENSAFLAETTNFFERLTTNIMAQGDNYALLVQGVQSSVDKMLNDMSVDQQSKLVGELRSINANLSRPEAIQVQRALLAAIERLAPVSIKGPSVGSMGRTLGDPGQLQAGTSRKQTQIGIDGPPERHAPSQTFETSAVHIDGSGRPQNESDLA